MEHFVVVYCSNVGYYNCKVRLGRGCPLIHTTPLLLRGGGGCRRVATSDEVGDVHRHLLNLSVVELLNVLESADIVLGEEVDRHTLTSETTTTTDAVDVVLQIGSVHKRRG